jgi:hypothetical protein
MVDIGLVAGVVRDGSVVWVVASEQGVEVAADGIVEIRVKQRQSG